MKDLNLRSPYGDARLPTGCLKPSSANYPKNKTRIDIRVLVVDCNPDTHVRARDMRQPAVRLEDNLSDVELMGSMSDFLFVDPILEAADIPVNTTHKTFRSLSIHG